MRQWKRVVCALGVCLVMRGTVASAAPAVAHEAQMPHVIEQFTADEQSLSSTYPVRISPERAARFARFYSEEQATLAKMDFDSFSQEDKVDYLLLKNYLTTHQHGLELEKKQVAEMEPLLPFAKTIETAMEEKRQMQRPDGEKSAAALAGMVKSIAAVRANLEAKKLKVSPVVANRAVQATEQLKRNLKTWFDFSNGYDPEFTWWAAQPYNAADKALADYITFLKEKVVGVSADDKTTIIGDPVGRDALMNALNDDMIPYTPEELIAIAQTEYDWCLREMLKASHEMGCGDDWHKAVEKVKTMHVKPGEQPEMIRKLVQSGIDFVKKNDLVTVPPLAEETWRMVMMSPEEQKILPFFYGGPVISVAYPTDTMTFEDREMAMRGNNIPFSHAVAFHEMIPGHFLQGYMEARYRTYRQIFSTPYWYEGNSLWWEMLFWDKGYDTTPEERVGALVWRMHRSARIIFTMNFHLGKWTPQQCVDFLMDKVGFERENAVAEVRRSFNGMYEPLYQSAYLLGALQYRALHHELVDSKKMTDREFHDAILHENDMPLELLRADLEGLKLTRDYKTNWKFYGEHPLQDQK